MTSAPSTPTFGQETIGMPASSSSLPNTIGRYDVVRRLGQGAMGRVLLAQDPVLERLVAIKLLRNDLGLSPDHQRQLFERMRQEARASARVSHPNIVALFDMGEDDAYGLFLVFEYVLGSTLKDRIAAGRLEAAAGARMARELGEALYTAHAAGVLHRDIKPENVILSPSGSKIADFGIARLPESTLTRDGRLLGTPAYSSPESISHGVFSAQSDQFSLASTLYEALSQTRAFPGDDAVRVATLITTTQAQPIADRCGFDRMVDVVLQKAMHPDPSSRFTSCAEFGQALSIALGGASLQMGSTPSSCAGPSSTSSARAQDVGSRTLRIIAGAGTLGALLMATALQLTRGCQAESPAAPAASAAVALAEPSSRISAMPRKASRAALVSPKSSAPTEAAAPSNATSVPIRTRSPD